MVPQLRDAFSQLPKMNFGSLHARLADEHTWLYFLIWPELVAGDADRPLSVAIDQVHGFSVLFGILPKRMVFRAKNARSPHA